MTPNHALRLQTMLRAMREVILPAIDAQNPLARDQAQILIGNLQLLAAQAHRTYEYQLVELRDYVALLTALSEESRSGPATQRACEAGMDLVRSVRPIADASVAREAALAERLTELRAAVDTVLAASQQDGTPEFRRHVAAQVLAHAESQNTRERVWFAAAGLDAEAGSLPNLDQVLGKGFESP